MRLRRESWGFAIGSVLFALGAWPGYANAVGVTLDNLTYFVGSLFFTTAALIQLLLTGRPLPHRGSSQAARFDWFAAAIQFVGTLLFNVSTLAALLQSNGAEISARMVWRPDAYGSVAFLIASGLAVVATTDRESLWDPNARSWWSTWFGMAGSLAFGASAIGAAVDPASGELRNAAIANAGTFIGALCFLTAAVLALPPRPAR
ncbi:NADH-ubiquinone oxidoreductase [Microterricola viridarii]|uniref:NADH-ubiquinone oxidoreductase n=1 Tax=Microterricola viridarii TaxID=412690 RepID=A0A0Y0QE13_9MICO|nr:NADH-ubiquinone oxidoreductase [Microterricola viridarii]